MFALAIWSLTFALGTALWIHSAFEEIRSGTLTTSDEVVTSGDFPMFYVGAKNAIHGDGSRLYEKSYIVETAAQHWGIEGDTPEEIDRWYRYYNPPIYLLFLAPLTVLPTHMAYLAFVAFSLICACLLYILIAQKLRLGTRSKVMLGLALPGFIPVHFSLAHGQPTLLIALLVVMAFLLAEAGRSKHSALFVVLSAVKPQLAASSLLALLREHPRTLAPIFILGFVLLVLPYFLMASDAIFDYIRLVRGRGAEDLTEPTMLLGQLGWTGFTHALTGTTHPHVSLGLSFLTLLLYLKVFRQGDRHLVWAGGIFCFLIAVPHSHPQDWTLAIPAAAILLAREMSNSHRAVTVALLMAGYVGVNSWRFAAAMVMDGDQTIYFATLASLGLLLWCAILPWLEGRQRLNERRFEPANSGDLVLSEAI